MSGVCTVQAGAGFCRCPNDIMAGTVRNGTVNGTGSGFGSGQATTWHRSSSPACQQLVRLTTLVGTAKALESVWWRLGRTLPCTHQSRKRSLNATPSSSPQGCCQGNTDMVGIRLLPVFSGYSAFVRSSSAGYAMAWQGKRQGRRRRCSGWALFASLLHSPTPRQSDGCSPQRTIVKSDRLWPLRT